MFNIASILISGVLIISSTAIGNSEAFSNVRLKDRLAIIDVINSVGTLADLKEWSQLKQLFAEKVTVDYTSLFPTGFS